ncbi:MAG TPA: hypothetical protein VFE51_02700 [Verrucomicrobiae bacterium]|nr:hypothetical protein [Verrucomicrobiae bacterium]
MKRKYAITLAVIAGATLATAALHPGTQASKEIRVIFLRSNGETIGQLHVVSGTLCEFNALNSSGLIECDKATGFIKANYGVAVTIRSGTSRTNSIRVTADEIEARPEAN